MGARAPPRARDGRTTKRRREPDAGHRRSRRRPRAASCLGRRPRRELVPGSLRRGQPAAVRVDDAADVVRSGPSRAGYVLPLAHRRGDRCRNNARPHVELHHRSRSAHTHASRPPSRGYRHRRQSVRLESQRVRRACARGKRRRRRHRSRRLRRRNTLLGGSRHRGRTPGKPGRSHRARLRASRRYVPLLPRLALRRRHPGTVRCCHELG